MVARSFHQRAGVAAEYFIRKICIFLRVIVIRREEEQKRQEKVESERARRGGRLKQNQLFIRIGREKVLIIRGKYKLNTRREKCTRLPRPLLPLPLLLCRRSLSLSLSLVFVRGSPPSHRLVLGLSGSPVFRLPSYRE